MRYYQLASHASNYSLNELLVTSAGTKEVLRRTAYYHCPRLRGVLECIHSRGYPKKFLKGFSVSGEGFPLEYLHHVLEDLDLLGVSGQGLRSPS